MEINEENKLIKNTMNSLTPILDFDFLETYSVGTLIIVDTSRYKHLVGENTYLDITTPGKKTAITFTWAQSKTHFFNGKTLELDCDNDDCETALSDGIYKIKLYVCEGTKFCKEKHYLRTTKALLRLDQVLIAMALNCCLPDKAVMEKYFEIELLIKSAHANLRDGNIKQASCEFEKAVELLEDFEQCFSSTSTDSSCKTVTKSCG